MGNAIGNILWPVVLIGGIGGFIDLLIGKKGQDAVRDTMLRWWVVFSDIDWKDFGQREISFSTQAIMRIFGQNIFSYRRIISAFLTVFTLLIVAEFF